MKTFAGFLLFLLMSFCSLSAGAQPAEISYTPELQWEHFRGTAPENDSALAKIYIQIRLDVHKVNFMGRVRYKSSARMDASQSWVKEGHKTDLILQHEQLHFDIAQYCAQALQKEIDAMKPFLTDRKRVKKSFEKWLTHMSFLNEAFDRDFHRHYNAETIQSWKQKLAE